MTEAEVPISAEEEEEMFQKFIKDMNNEVDELATPYHLWVKLRCETKLSDMIPDLSGNKYWEKLLALEEEALKLTGTDVIQAAYSKTMAIQEYARLHAVEDSMKQAEGIELTQMELKMLEQFHTIQNNLTQNVDWIEAEWRDMCKHVLMHADLFRSKPFFHTGESSKTAENRSSALPQTDQAPGLEQMKGVVVDTIISCLHKYSIATDKKIAIVQTNLTETVRASIHSEIVETVQTTIKSMIDESVQTATAPLLEMMQAMSAQIEELCKMQADKTQEQIRADVETARRLQDEDEARERLRKEIEDKDHELAKQCNEEEKAAQTESTPAQASHSMKMRNKIKRKAVATLMKRVERSGLEELQPVGQFEEPLDEEEEEDTTRLNRRKKKAIETSIVFPRSGPIVAQPSRPSRPVSGGFGFNQRTPDISSVFVGWRIDAERREREWKEREEEERRKKEKENEKGDHPILSLFLFYEQFTFVIGILFQN
ncbi:E3 ubiquitin-protein ligase BRE1A-like [Impatiens glandulifera]|uniref:E3 ubiquitin-protein ligase BRE1A-like n=1 Tax=Impatiens glandulifera TaxID=253017 RepID=UPI001FB0D5CD|nr:E3 ubiquitin-protein ligase BRE1A-like [Impatiens glandulifera]